MPLALQPKLLRVLQERAVRRLGEAREVEVDVRVVEATSWPLGAGGGISAPTSTTGWPSSSCASPRCASGART